MKMMKRIWISVCILVMFLSSLVGAANFPTRGDANWGQTLETWVLVGHNADGTLQGSISQGEWDQNGVTLTSANYIDADTFDVSGDYSGQFHVGRAVWVQLTGTDCYSTISAVDYNGTKALYTTVDLNDTCPLDNTMTNAKWGIISADTISSLPQIPLDVIPATLTGKDADTVDGIEGAEIFKKDGSVAMTAAMELLYDSGTGGNILRSGGGKLFNVYAGLNAVYIGYNFEYNSGWKSVEAWNDATIYKRPTMLGFTTADQKITLYRAIATSGAAGAAISFELGALSIGALTTSSTALVPNLNANMLNGYDAGNGASNLLILDGSGLVPLADIPSTLTGKDADTVDGLEGATLEESAEIDSDIATHAAISSAHHTATVDTNAQTICGTGEYLDGDGGCVAESATATANSIALRDVSGILKGAPAVTGDDLINRSQHGPLNTGYLGSDILVGRGLSGSSAWDRNPFGSWTWTRNSTGDYTCTHNGSPGIQLSDGNYTVIVSSGSSACNCVSFGRTGTDFDVRCRNSSGSFCDAEVHMMIIDD